MTLDMPVVLSRTVSPACLPAASTDPDQHSDKDAAVMGWGPSSKWLTNRSVEIMTSIPISYFTLNMLQHFVPAKGDVSSATTFKQGKIAIVANDQDCRSQDGYGRFVTANNLCISGTDTSVYTCPVSTNNEYLFIVYHSSDSLFNCCQSKNVTPLVICMC